MTSHPPPASACLKELGSLAAGVCCCAGGSVKVSQTLESNEVAHAESVTQAKFRKWRSGEKFLNV